MLKDASHIVVGTVVKVHKGDPTEDYYKTTECVAEIVVAGVLKGNDIARKDRIHVKYHYNDWSVATPSNNREWDLRKGCKPGMPVQLYLEGSSSRGFRVCEPIGFATPDVLPFPLDENPPRQTLHHNVDSACLKITHTMSPGDNDSNYEFTIGDKTIPSYVRRSYHPEYQYVYQGSLYGIVDEVAGVPPEKPEEFRTLASLLIVLKENGWEAVGKTTEQLPGGSSSEKITTINFRRKPAG